MLRSADQGQVAAASDQWWNTPSPTERESAGVCVGASVHSGAYSLPLSLQPRSCPDRRDGADCGCDCDCDGARRARPGVRDVALLRGEGLNCFPDSPRPDLVDHSRRSVRLCSVHSLHGLHGDGKGSGEKKKNERERERDVSLEEGRSECERKWLLIKKHLETGAERFASLGPKDLWAPRKLSTFLFYSTLLYSTVFLFLCSRYAHVANQG